MPRASHPVIVAVLFGLGCITFEPIAARCSVSDTCGAGTVCNGQACVSPECVANVDCDPGEVCLGNRCSAAGSTGSGGETGDTGEAMTGATGDTSATGMTGPTFTITDVRGTSVNLDGTSRPRVIDTLRIVGDDVDAATAVTAIDQADMQAFSLPIASTATGEITVSIPDTLATRAQIQGGVTIALSVQHASGTLAPLVRINRGEQGSAGPSGARGATGVSGNARPAGQPVTCNNAGWRIFNGDVQCATGPTAPSASWWVPADVTGTPLAPAQIASHATLAITAGTASGALRVANAAVGGATLKVVGDADFRDVSGVNGGLGLPFYLRRTHCQAACGSFEVLCDAGDVAFAVSCWTSDDATMHAYCPICASNNCLDAQVCGGCGAADTACQERTTPSQTSFPIGVRCAISGSSPSEAMGYVLCVRDQ